MEATPLWVSICDRVCIWRWSCKPGALRTQGSLALWVSMCKCNGSVFLERGRSRHSVLGKSYDV